MKHCIFITSIIISLATFGQNWNGLEQEIQLSLKKKEKDLAIKKSLKAFSWVRANESDSSIHIALCLNYIGKAYFNRDSLISFNLRALEVLEYQKSLFLNKNDYKSAEPFYKEILNISLETFGKKHSDYSGALYNLGNCYYDLNDFKSSEYYLKKSLDATEKYLGKEHVLYGSALSSLGGLYLKADKLKESEDYLLKALEVKNNNVNGKAKDLVPTLNSLSIIYKLQGNYEKSIKYTKKSLEIIDKNGILQSENGILILSNLGNLYLEIGDYNLALKYFNQSSQISKKLFGEESLYYSKNLMGLAVYHDRVGDYLLAESEFKKILNITAKILGENHIQYSYVLGNYSNLLFHKGDYELAAFYSDESIQIIRSVLGEESLEFAKAINNLGEIYSAIGNYSSAEVYYKKSLAIKKIVVGELSPDYAINLLSLGSHYINLSDYKNADYFLKQSLSVTTKIYGKVHQMNAIIFNNLGLLNSNFGDLKSAEINYKKALGIKTEMRGENNPENTSTLGNLGIINMEMGKFNLAIKYFQKSLEISSVNKVNTLHNIGILYQKTGDFEKAKLIYNEIFDNLIYELSRNFNWLSEKEKKLYYNKVWPTLASIFNYSARFYNDNSKSSEISYNSSLVSKSILMETSRSFYNSIVNSNDSNVINNYQELKRLRNLNSKLMSEQTVKQELILRTERQADSLDRLLSRKTSAYVNYKNNFALTWKDVQTNLTNEEASIEFVMYFEELDSSNHYMALVVKHGDKYPQLVKLCKVDELKQYSPETELNAIYDLIWKPLLPSLTNVKTIYYSPSGLLNNIPFQALYKEENGQREYVMDKFTLHQLTSTRYLALGLKQKEQETIESSIALFGGISYNDYPNAIVDTTNHNESSEAASVFKRELDSTRTGASYLPGTKTEVETISDVLNAKQWQVDIAVGKNASENKIKSLSGVNSKAILHIATHGFAYPDKVEKRKDLAFSMMSSNEKYKASDNPMIRCGLLFGGANLTWQGKGDSLLNTTNEDGVLTAYELSELDLSNTKLAVLSACETGKGAIQGSEGTFGLKRALKLAGVDNMIVSLWKVPDDATMEMMTLFYSELANTKKPISSFETAQKSMRVKYPNEPKKWAGFVLVR
jgi:CHAT domain-containing protein/Tfp pilus assembly protein PilF